MSVALCLKEMAIHLYHMHCFIAIMNLTSAGAAVGSAFCGVDTAAVNDSTAWVFGITFAGITLQHFCEHVDSACNIILHKIQEEPSTR